MSDQMTPAKWRRLLCRPVCGLIGHDFVPQWTPNLDGAICIRCRDAYRPLTEAELEDIHAEACT
jgi:hypothetical protein